VEDCYHDRYDGAPTDGSEWTAANCRYRVVRGGARMDPPEPLRSASRDGSPITLQDDHLGFRVARTLNRCVGRGPAQIYEYMLVFSRKSISRRQPTTDSIGYQPVKSGR